MRGLFAAAAGLILAMSLTAIAVAQHSCGTCGQATTCAVPGDICNVCGGAPLCSACMSGGNGCNLALPECGICGTAQGWDCSGEEGIDIDSLTPAAQSKKLYEASLARIIFEVPEDAGVSLLDQKMATLGTTRSFVVPVESQDKDYRYEVKVDVVRGGKKYFKKIRINILRAGMILAVKVEAPPVADGEPALIILEEPVPVHPGGKPPEEGVEVDADLPAPPMPET